MKNILIAIYLLVGSNALLAQDIYGLWAGIITDGGEQFKFEVNIEKGERNDPTILHCRSCKKLRASIFDYRDAEKSIEAFGIINHDASINFIDTKLVNKEHLENETRTRYQVAIEMKGGVAWLVGYWQDYNAKGRKVKQGKIYLKREKEIVTKA
jgi:uncharacterized DUF497 family protein